MPTDGEEPTWLDRIWDGTSPAVPLYEAYNRLTSRQRDTVAAFSMLSEGARIIEDIDSRLRDDLLRQQEKVEDLARGKRLREDELSDLRRKCEVQDEVHRSTLDAERAKISALEKRITEVERSAQREIIVATQRADKAVERAALTEDQEKMFAELESLNERLRSSVESEDAARAELSILSVRLEEAERKAKLQSPVIDVGENDVQYRFKPRYVEAESAKPRGLWTLEEFQSLQSHLFSHGASDGTVIRVGAYSIEANIGSDVLAPEPWGRPSGMITGKSAEAASEEGSSISLSLLRHPPLALLLVGGVLVGALLGGFVF